MRAPQAGCQWVADPSHAVAASADRRPPRHDTRQTATFCTHHVTWHTAGPHGITIKIKEYITQWALPTNKPETTSMVITARWPQVSHTALSYSCTYSRRHVIGYGRRSTSLWLVKEWTLIITRADHHLAIATFQHDRWRHYQLQVRLDVVCPDIYIGLFFDYGAAQQCEPDWLSPQRYTGHQAQHHSKVCHNTGRGAAVHLPPLSPQGRSQGGSWGSWGPQSNPTKIIKDKTCTL